MGENEPFADVLTKYSHALLVHSLRMTGCTGLHTLEQRCARWMLTTLGRVSADRFSVTRGFLAMLLGCSRPSASLIIEDLQYRGILQVERGRIIITNRDALRGISCECCAVIKETYAQVGD